MHVATQFSSSLCRETEINSTNDIIELSSVDKQCLIIDPTIIDLAENESHMDLTLSTIKNELHVVQFLSYPIQE